METKKCNKCSQVKPLDAYGINILSKDGHRGDCKECVNAYAKDWSKKYPERRQASNRRWVEKRKAVSSGRCDKMESEQVRLKLALRIAEVTKDVMLYQDQIADLYKSIGQSPIDLETSMALNIRYAEMVVMLSEVAVHYNTLVTAIGNSTIFDTKG
jgi:hypothetical protein